MRRALPFAALVLPVVMSACSSGGGGSGGESTVGQVEVLLVDAPADDVTQIVVTITRIDAHVAGGGDWVTLVSMEKTLDLLTLQGGTFASLGIGPIPAGKVTQLRLELKADGPQYVVTPDNAVHPLKIPSGAIKINAGFDWPACGTGKITLDFDGKKSIKLHEGGGADADGWHMSPVIHLKSVEHDGGKCKGAGDGGRGNRGGNKGPDDDAGKPDPGQGNGNGMGMGMGMGNGMGMGGGKEKDAGMGNGKEKEKEKDAGKPEDPGNQGKGKEKDAGAPDDAGKPEDPGNQGKGKEKDGGGMPEDPGSQGKGRNKDAGPPTDAGHSACAAVTCPMGQFCLNGTCQAVMGP